MLTLPRVALLLALISVLAVAQTARAAAPAVEITVSGDPTESITAQLGVSGTSASTSAQLSLNVKAAGGRPCAANASADDGSSVIDGDYLNNAGAFARSENWTFRSAGSYVLCAWLSDTSQSGAPVVATATATVIVRLPHVAVSVAVPPTAAVGNTFQVTTSAQSEVERTVSVAALPDTGRGCPPNWEAALSSDGARTVREYWNVTGGPFTMVDNLSESLAGTYLLCGYLSYNGSAEGTASASIRVLPPCVVPSVRRGATISSVRRRLAAAGCTPGSIRHRRSGLVRRGRVVSLVPPAGKTLAPGAKVTIVVSSGRR